VQGNVFQNNWGDEQSGIATRAGHLSVLRAHTHPKRIRFTADVWNLMDDDGLRLALKPARDGLKDAWVVHYDRPRSGYTFQYFQVIHRSRRGVLIEAELLHGDATADGAGG
jgi:hypothetical protein